MIKIRGSLKPRPRRTLIKFGEKQNFRLKCKESFGWLVEDTRLGVKEIGEKYTIILLVVDTRLGVK